MIGTVLLVLMCLFLGWLLILFLGSWGMFWRDKLQGETDYERDVKRTIERLGPDLSTDPFRLKWEKKAIRRLVKRWEPERHLIDDIITVRLVRNTAHWRLRDAGYDLDEWGWADDEGNLKESSNG